MKPRQELVQKTNRKWGLSKEKLRLIRTRVDLCLKRQFIIISIPSNLKLTLIKSAILVEILLPQDYLTSRCLHHIQKPYKERNVVLYETQITIYRPKVEETWCAEKMENLTHLFLSSLLPRSLSIVRFSYP